MAWTNISEVCRVPTFGSANLGGVECHVFTENDKLALTHMDEGRLKI